MLSKTQQRENTRRQQKEDKKMAKRMNKFSPEQRKAIIMMVTEETSRTLINIADMINTCYYNAMRENKISDVRAKVILERTEALIQIENSKYEGI